MSVFRSRPVRLPFARPAPEGPSIRVILRVIGVALAVAGLLWLLYVSRQVLIWLAIAAFFAVAINPMVNAINDRLRVPRAIAILVVYLLGLAVLGGIALVFVPPLISAGQELTDTIPGYVDQLQSSRLVQRLDEEYDFSNRLETEATDALSGIAGPSTAVDLLQRAFNGVIAFISILVICFLLSLYGRRARAWLLAQVADDRRGRVGHVLDRIYRVVAGYLVGVLLVAAVGAFAVWLFLTIIGVPFAPLLAAWVFFATLIPLVGATLGAIPYITVAFFQGWALGVAAIVFVLVYQQIENHVVQPVIHNRTVHLNPLWIILAVLVGAQVLGIVGVLAAIPIAGIAQVLIQDWWGARRGADADEPETAVVVIE